METIIMKKVVLSAILLSAMLSAPTFALNLHELNGSDLGLGVGARAISMGGAFSALADDASTIYWNPAGLTEVKQNEAMLMVNPDPTRYSFKGFIFRPEKWEKSKTKLTIGIAQINRLKYIADGDWAEGNASHLIDLSMISVERNYVGGLNSRTVDHRITVAGRVPGKEKLSLGLTYIDFECVTTFYLNGAGRTCQVVAYETMDFGALYKLNDNHQFAIALRNPLERTKPKYLTIGAAWLKPNYRVTADIEHIFGEYSNELRKCNFIMLRAGYERDINRRFKARAGVIIPVRAKTSTLGDLRSKIPNPKIDATVGAGYTFKNYTLDLALYGDPGKSYVTDTLKFGSALTLKADF
jgi:hypothetical protein